MKKLLFIITILPLFCISQKLPKLIASAEIDKFENKMRIQSEPIRVKSALGRWAEISFRSFDTSLFLNLAGNIGVGAVGTKDSLIFLFTDKTRFSIAPTDMQISSVDYNMHSYYSHQYYINESQIKILAEKTLASVRRYYNSNYADFDIKEEDRAKRLNKLATQFLEVYNRK
jgi:hypothetical protein